jgi:replicative DNA helicase
MTDHRIFKLTDDWQDVPDDAILEPGGEIDVNLTTGKKQARRAQPKPARAQAAAGDPTGEFPSQPDQAPAVDEYDELMRRREVADLTDFLVDDAPGDDYDPLNDERLNAEKPDDGFNRFVIDAQEPDRPDVRTIEETLLVGCLASPEGAARVVGEARPTDFYFERHRAFARRVFPALVEGRHVDRLTLAADLPEETDPAKAKSRADFLAFADQVFDMAQKNPPALGKVEAYLTIFVDGARRRLAKELVRKAGEALDLGEASPPQAAAQVFKVVADLEASRRLVGAFRSEADDWATYFAALEAAQNPGGAGFLGLDTGFDHLNNVVNGLTEGLFVLGAAPSTGKTTFAKQLGDQVVTLNPDAACLFVSYEQSRGELRVKSLSRLSGVENRDILRGRLNPAEAAWARVRAAGDEYAQKTAGRFFILEADKTTTPDRVRLAALQVKRATQAERLFIVLDYLQIIPTEEEYRDTRNRVDAVVSDLRRIGRDLGAAVMAVSSVGRMSYDTPTLAAYKESGGIEYGADVGAVMSGDKDKTKGFDLVEGLRRDWVRVNLAVVKNRNGERSLIEFNFFPAVSRFVEVGSSTLAGDSWDAASA